ncbi:filamentous hemagglutinin N-terminal domain-containing protein [Anabaena azotica]|uniref:two-partner secretion domain-containing protein n=1 Tax=Anabaena azotica TaxID=197653 RepID=UPI0039A6632C
MKSIPKALNIWFQTLLGALTTGLLTPGILLAQVISDGTTQTTVNSSGNNFNILNGIEKDNNLFHSFTNFSVPTSGSATFDLTHTPNITNIFSRVTGGNASNINGLIQTLNSNNPVNLFLMNPSGIIFGPNASLNISGSFVGTTANSIKFADGSEFSVVNPSSPPLLTMSVPIGLQMGQNPGGITVQGTGHQLTGGFPFPVSGTVGSSPLSVQPGHTLALVGGDIHLNGGVLTGASGQIELGAIGTQNTSAFVELVPNSFGWTFNYKGIESLGQIELGQHSLLDTSGKTPGSIQLTGQNISMGSGSLILIDNQGTQESGTINIRASDTFRAIGILDTFSMTRIINYTQGSGDGGDITISARRLMLDDGAYLITNSYGQGRGGDITVNAAELVQLQSSIVEQGFNTSVLATDTFGSGDAGKLTISSPRVSVQSGGQLLGLTFGSGTGGSITINATESTELIGNEFLALVITNGYASGKAGDIEVNTPRLRLENGGYLGAENSGQGSGGKIVVNASERIDVVGRTIDVSGIFTSDFPSTIAARTIPPSQLLQQIFQLNPIPSGNSGSITLNTPQLTVSDEAEISVVNQGNGNGGRIEINGNQIRLNNQGKFLATTDSGQGGDIFITTNALLMRQGSSITATANGTGNGGNITIASPIIAGLENSDIVANAFQGNGGKINITTQGIFGLQFRDQLSGENDITASSEFGVNGTVDINNFGVVPNSGLVELSTDVTDPSQQITSGCSTISSSRFVATGRGGIPQNPTQELRSDRSWSDLRDLSPYRKTAEVTAQIPASPQTLVQATSWYRNALGKIELVTDDESSVQVQPLNCTAVSQN